MEIYTILILIYLSKITYNQILFSYGIHAITIKGIYEAEKKDAISQ